MEAEGNIANLTQRAGTMAARFSKPLWKSLLYVAVYTVKQGWKEDFHWGFTFLYPLLYA